MPFHTREQAQQRASPAVQGPTPVHRALPAAQFLLTTFAKVKANAITMAVTTMPGHRIKDGFSQGQDIATTGTGKAHGSGTASGEHQQDTSFAPILRHSNAKPDGSVLMETAARLLRALSVSQDHTLRKEQRAVPHVLLELILTPQVAARPVPQGPIQAFQVLRNCFTPFPLKCCPLKGQS